MKLGIIGAMPQEISILLEKVEVNRTHQLAMREFIEGTLNGVDVVIVLSRVGKTSAAITTTLLINKFNVDQIVLTGVAGAIDPGLNVGDIVIGECFIHHDMDASPIFPKFEIPLLATATFFSDKKLVNNLEKSASNFVENILHYIDEESLKKFCTSTPRITTGTIASGDQFIKNKAQTLSIAQSLASLNIPTPRCTEMEGASVAQACYELGVPFSIVRIISDKANESSPIDFNLFIDSVACHLTGGIIFNLCKKITQLKEAKRLVF